MYLINLHVIEIIICVYEQHILCKFSLINLGFLDVLDVNVSRKS